MPSAHRRPKEYQNIYRARRFKGDEEKFSNTRWERETKRMVNKGHAEFFQARGVKTPPWVSTVTLGAFDTYDSP